MLQSNTENKHTSQKRKTEKLISQDYAQHPRTVCDRRTINHVMLLSSSVLATVKRYQMWSCPTEDGTRNSTSIPGAGSETRKGVVCLDCQLEVMVIIERETVDLQHNASIEQN